MVVAVHPLGVSSFCHLAHDSLAEARHCCLVEAHQSLEAEGPVEQPNFGKVDIGNEGQLDHHYDLALVDQDIAVVVDQLLVAYYSL